MRFGANRKTARCFLGNFFVF
jgi:hypothetical protein